MFLGRDKISCAVFAGLLLFALTLAACENKGREPGVLYFRMKTNPATLDPANMTAVDEGAIAAKLYSGLVRLGEDLSIIPDIAESWEVLDGGRLYRFKLRDNAFFANGRKVEAGDFKYSYERILDPATKSPNTWVLDLIEGAKDFMNGKAKEVAGLRAVDAHTLEIKLAAPFSPFLNLLTMPASYVVPSEEVKRLGDDFAAHPVGGGPYVLKEWLPNRSMTLVPDERYFGKKPEAKGIVYRIIPEDLTAVAEFEVGNLDMIEIPASAYARYKGDPEFAPRLKEVQALNTYYVGINCARPPFDDPEVRRALNMALDKRHMLELFFEGRGRLATGPVPDALRKWAAPVPYPYRPDEARAVFKRKGLIGRKVLFFVSDDQQNVDIAEVIQSYLNKAGLDVQIRKLEWSAYRVAIVKGEADLFWIGWWADYADPENFLFPVFHSSNHGEAGNRTRYTNKEADRLIEAGRAAPDQGVRDRDYAEAERMIAADAPWIFMWHRTDHLLPQPWIAGLEAYPIYTMDKGNTIKIAR